MSSLFGGAKAPAPQPVPVSPMDDSVAIAERNKAAQNAAAADAKQRGRQSTVAFGAKLASDEQYDRGVLKSKSRSASREMLG